MRLRCKIIMKKNCVVSALLVSLACLPLAACGDIDEEDISVVEYVYEREGAVDKSGDEILDELVDEVADYFDEMIYMDDVTGYEISYNVFLPDTYDMSEKDIPEEVEEFANVEIISNTLDVFFCVFSAIIFV